MTSTKSYNEQYWRANRKRLLADRAKRYREDKEFREAAIARSRARVALGQILRGAKVATVKHAGGTDKVRTFSHLCAAANRSKDVIYRWRKLGIIPAPTYRDKRGSGVYADSQVKYVRALCHMIDHEDLDIDYPTLGKILRTFWPRAWNGEQALRAYLTREVQNGSNTKNLGRGDGGEGAEEAGGREGKGKAKGRSARGPLNRQGRRGQAAARKGQDVRR